MAPPHRRPFHLPHESPFHLPARPFHDFWLVPDRSPSLSPPNLPPFSPLSLIPDRGGSFHPPISPPDGRNSNAEVSTLAERLAILCHRAESGRSSSCYSLINLPAAQYLQLPAYDQEDDVLIMDGFLVNGIVTTPQKNSPKLAQKSDSDSPYKLSPTNLYKTELCASWEQSGWCRYGSRCQYAHGKEDMRPPSPRHPRHKSEICKQFAKTGDCLYGAQCRYKHIQPSSTANHHVPAEELTSPVRSLRLPSPTSDSNNLAASGYSRRLPIFEQICPASALQVAKKQ